MTLVRRGGRGYSAPSPAVAIEGSASLSRRLIAPALLATALLAACGPVSPELAARQCEDRANAAAGPTGEVGIGINNRGKVSTGIEIGVTSDFIRGRDPQAVYEDCVIAKTGQPPIRPLVLREGLLR